VNNLDLAPQANIGFIGADFMKREMKMVKRTLIAIAVIALLGVAAQAQMTPIDTGYMGPPVYAGGGNSPGLKVDDTATAIWPFEYKALPLCTFDVVMHVGMFVQVEKCNERKIKLVQVDCADPAMGKGAGDWPCYYDCEKVKIRANFPVKLGLEKAKVGNVLKDWSASMAPDTVDDSGSWNEIEICVKAWKADLSAEKPGNQVKVGTITITVKPNV
jgi:hypothetical protein